LGGKEKNTCLLLRGEKKGPNKKKKKIFFSSGRERSDLREAMWFSSRQGEGSRVTICMREREKKGCLAL